MKVLVIEDEPLAAERIELLVQKYDAALTIVAKIDSVEETLLWLNENYTPDLMLVDVQLSDGLSFEIFKKTNVRCPVIFTTAYDQYAIQAFKVNSIDYLLKPVTFADLSSALDKFKTLKNIQSPLQIFDIQELINSVKNLNKT
ncbi:MAG: response regulator, partial [Verrucomicrobia bacterium]|nr:response regulator [Cytophagales bacterium]